MALALAGAGVARLADWAALPEIARGTLVRVCPAYTVTSARGVSPQVHAVYASRSLPARARAMLAALRQAGAGLMDAPAPPATPPARHAS